jgi:hypothetical protein
MHGLTRLKTNAYLQELIQGGRVPLEPALVLARLHRDSQWEAMVRYLKSMRPDVPEECTALEDGIEWLLLQAPSEAHAGLSALFAYLGDRVSLSPLLMAFAGMHAEQAGHLDKAWKLFREAASVYPLDATVVGQFCAFVNKQNRHDEAATFLQGHPSRGAHFDDILTQLKRLNADAAHQR